MQWTSQECSLADRPENDMNNKIHLDLKVLIRFCCLYLAPVVDSKPHRTPKHVYSCIAKYKVFARRGQVNCDHSRIVDCFILLKRTRSSISFVGPDLDHSWQKRQSPLSRLRQDILLLLKGRNQNVLRVCLQLFWRLPPARTRKTHKRERKLKNETGQFELQWLRIKGTLTLSTKLWPLVSGRS